MKATITLAVLPKNPQTSVTWTTRPEEGDTHNGGVRGAAITHVWHEARGRGRCDDEIAAVVVVAIRCTLGWASPAQNYAVDKTGRVANELDLVHR